MKEYVPEIANDPKTALASYIQELEDLYYPWYKRAATRNYSLASAARIVALLSGFAPAVIAALLKNERFQNWTWGYTLQITLPIAGSLASAFLAQSRIAELGSLRENGRQRIQQLIADARVKFAAASQPKDYSDIHSALIVDVTKLEQEQDRVSAFKGRH